MAEKVVVIVSGGFDSSILLHDVVAGTHGKFDEIRVLSVNYNQRHKIELKSAKWQCKELGLQHEIVNLASVGKQILKGSSQVGRDIPVPEGHYAEEIAAITVVPNRNMLLLSIATSYLLSFMEKGDNGTVMYGCHKGDFDVYADCRPEFVEALSTAINLCDFKSVTLKAPYKDIHKWDIAQRGKELGLFEKGKFSGVPVLHMHTCYNGVKPACAKCPTCQERVLSCHRVGVVDPLPYKGGWKKALANALRVQVEYEKAHPQPEMKEAK